MKTRSWIAALALLALSACSGGGGVSETGNPQRSYLTSSADGYGSWQVANEALSGQWTVTSSTGVVQYIYSVGGSCGGATTYGFKPCTLASATCAPGAASCTGAPTVGDTFYVLEVPGSSVLIYAPTQNQLHAGTILGSCDAEIAGIYTSMPTLLGSIKLFGTYYSNEFMTTLVDASFGLYDTAAPKLFYATTAGGGTGVLSFPPSTCENGVRSFTLSGVPIRATLAAGGLWTFAAPPGQGSAISFRADLAADISDFANKTLYGFVVNDDPQIAFAQLQTGPNVAGRVALTSLMYSAGTQPDITGHYITSAKSIGSGYGFNGIPPGPNGTTYANNLFSGLYPTPGDIPGLFVNPVGATPDAGSFWVGMRSQGKLLLYISRFGNRGGVMRNSGVSIFFEQ